MREPVDQHLKIGGACLTNWFSSPGESCSFPPINVQNEFLEPLDCAEQLLEGTKPPAGMRGALRIPHSRSNHSHPDCVQRLQPQHVQFWDVWDLF